MADVFISYARNDQAMARRVARAMQSHGLDVWWDADLPAHRAYSEEIERNLAAAKAVIVLWSAAAAKSQWVRAEADFARNAGKLVQVQVDTALPPIPFNQIQCASLKGWRGGEGHAGWSKLLGSVRALVTGEAASPQSQRRVSWWKQRRFHAAAVLVALAAVATLWLVPQWLGMDGDKRPVVAVLPFESLDNRDESLVAGIWEDTRQALSRNPQLLVLGPNTSEELAEEDGTAKRAADFLVEASVRSAGDRIRVSANLVRTEDGAQMWSESFDRRLDDVFQLQQQIAGEIEGRIRGRLAERGGTMPEHIATNGEVYALYSDARAKLRKREIRHYDEAARQLQQVVRMDPNFAPGWATLAVAKRFGLAIANAETAEADARRAVALAPNLAAGHAALGFVLGKTPAARAALQRAIAIDPNDIEAINWLANSLEEDQVDEKIRLYSKVVELEPLWWPAILNKLNILLNTGQIAAANQELERLRSLEAGERLMALAATEIGTRSGDLSAVADAGLALLNSRPDVDADMVRFNTFAALLQLGYEDEARAVSPPPPFGPVLWRDDPRGLEMVEALDLPPGKFFVMAPLSMAAGRLYVLRGRGAKLAELYRSAAGSPEKMMTLTGSDLYLELAPVIAMALRQAGDPPEASRILAAANSPAIIARAKRLPATQAMLARVYAVQGRREEALALLTSAVSRGWLPRLPAMRTDIAVDPAMEPIKGDPRFQRARQAILGHIAKERAELGPVTVKYPLPQRSS